MRDWLKEKRIAKGLTLHELSAQVGVSWQSISYYENGSRRPTPDVAMKIGACLDFPWTRFYEDGKKESETA